MFFIPYAHIQIKSYLQSDEIESRLNAQIDAPSILAGFMRGKHKYFEGEMENRRFKLRRILYYRNSFAPVIVGKVQPDIGSTTIDLTLRLDFNALAMISFISLIILSSRPALSEIGILLLIYLLMIIFFNNEANTVIKYLVVLFKGD